MILKENKEIRKITENSVESENEMARTKIIQELIQELEVFNDVFIENYPHSKISNWRRITKIFNSWYRDYKRGKDNIPTLKGNNLEDYIYELMMYPYNTLLAFTDECSEYWTDNFSINFADLNLDELENNIEEAYSKFLDNNAGDTQEVMQQLLQPVKSVVANISPTKIRNTVTQHLKSYEKYYKTDALRILCSYLKINKGSEEYKIVLGIVRGYSYDKNSNIDDILCIYRENCRVLTVFNALRKHSNNLNIKNLEEGIKNRLIRLKYELLMNPEKYISMKNFIGVFFNL